MKFLLFVLLISQNLISDDDFHYSYLSQSCSPDKKPSISISFHFEKQDCKKLASYPKITINLWKDVPSLPFGNSSYVFNDNKGASFSFCSFKDKCKPIKQFGLHFDKVSKKSGKGNFMIKKHDDVILKSKFKLIVCSDSVKKCM